MDLLAREVFDPQKHISKDPKRELNKGKFKNQLRTYIECELSGSKKKELRILAGNAIEFVCSSIVNKFPVFCSNCPKIIIA